MRFVPLAYSDLARLIGRYPVDTEILAYFVDTEVEVQLPFTLGWILQKGTPENPVGFIVDSSLRPYLVVGLIQSIPCPKFILAPSPE